MELEFEWADRKRTTIGIQDEDDVMIEEGPVFLHFKHENYRPIWLKPDADGRLRIRMMVPNTRLFFFFTVNNENHVSDEYMNIFLEQPEIVKFAICEQDYMFLLQGLNLYESGIESDDVISPSNYFPNVKTIPRRTRPVYRPPKIASQKDIRPRWIFGKSLFKDWRVDDDTFLNRCFEADWKSGKYANFIKNEEDRNNLKEYLRSVYKPMKDCYKVCSSHSNSDKLYAIGKNGITEIFQQMG
jgi:hypothetical protein